MTEQNNKNIGNIKYNLKLIQEIELSHNKIEEINKKIQKKYYVNKQYLVFLNNIMNDSVKKYNSIMQNLN